MLVFYLYVQFTYCAYAVFKYTIIDHNWRKLIAVFQPTTSNYTLTCCTVAYRCEGLVHNIVRNVCSLAFNMTHHLVDWMWVSPNKKRTYRRFVCVQMGMFDWFVYWLLILLFSCVRKIQHQHMIWYRQSIFEKFASMCLV